jgi:3'-phosphoadenosine 5'-phosphosulfate (PAPS) 3'-phosphatase
VRELHSTGVPVLSEEGKEIPAEERQAWQHYWLVDPLDGTKEFIKRNGEFTVNIALMHPLHPTPALPGGEGGVRSFDARYATEDPRTYGQLKQWARGMRKEPTEAEATLWRMLRHDNLGVRFRRQHVLGEYILDFACLKKRLVIEVDGGIHQEQKEEDALREQAIKDHGFGIIRFTNEEVLEDEAQVFERIKAAVDSRPDVTAGLDYERDAAASGPLPHRGRVGDGVPPSLGTHTPLAAVLYVPVKDILYFAWSGGGAYKLEQAGTRNTTSALKLAALAQRLPLSMSRTAFTIVASRSHNSPDTEAFIARMKDAHGEVAITNMGSALKICLVAEGAADAYPRYAPTMEWDTAAGHAIANEAGKQLIDITTDAPMRYNKHSLVNNWFIVQ